jgi:hypothetical protein
LSTEGNNQHLGMGLWEFRGETALLTERGGKGKDEWKIIPKA